MIPIFVDGDMTVMELARALSGIGYHLRRDSAGRMVDARIPPLLMRDPVPVADNDVRLKRARAKA